MEIGDYIANLFGATRQGAMAPRWLQALGAMARWEVGAGSSAERDGRLYQQLSWIQVAVSAVATSAAGVPFSVARRVGEKTRDIPNHSFELLLSKPNPFESRFELLRDLISYYRLTGNGYLWLSRESATAAPDELFVLPSQHVLPVPDARMGLAGYLFNSGYGPDIPLYPWEICHLKSFNPFSRFIGLSPIEAIQIGAGGDLAAQTWSANFYGKDNAKIPGALAFKDMVSEPVWTQIKADIKAGWGGTQRSGPLMLRGAGAGGVDWVAMGLSQNDMQYLDSRRFTKEEVFAIFAPGLASTLDVNATEANSMAGKATFIEFAIWPLLSAFAEKITNDVLPAYGRNLAGSFDDIRPSDKLLELQEQDRAEKVLTIDELRDRYWQLGPLADGRGTRLLSEPVSPPLVTTIESTAEDGAQPLKLLTDGREQLQIKAIALLPDEESMLGAVSAEHEADLLTTLEATLEPIMVAEATRVLAQWGLDVALLPLADWLAGFLPLASAALSRRPAADDPVFGRWLTQTIVNIVTRAKAFVVERIATWLPDHPEIADRALPQFELVWAALLDGHACAQCQALDGTPQSQIPAGLEPGGIHPYCRCRWELQAVEVAHAR